MTGLMLLQLGTSNSTPKLLF